MTPGLPHAVSCARHKPAPLFVVLTLLRQDFAADQTAHHLVMGHAHNPETRMLIGESVLFSIFPLSKQSSLPTQTVCTATCMQALPCSRTAFQEDGLAARVAQLCVYSKTFYADRLLIRLTMQRTSPRYIRDMQLIQWRDGTPSKPSDDSESSSESKP